MDICGGWVMPGKGGCWAEEELARGGGGRLLVAVAVGRRGTAPGWGGGGP